MLSTPRTGPCAINRDADLVGLLDEVVFRGRRIVVAVALVAPVHEAADTLDAAERECPVGGDREGEHAVLEPVRADLHGVLDGASALDRLQRGPPERRRRHPGDDGRAATGDDPDVPLALLGARRHLELVLQLVEVEPHRVVLVVDLECDRPVLDGHPVEPPSEELATVEPSAQPLGDAGARHPLLVQQGLVAGDPLRRDPSSVRELERDVLPPGRDPEAELHVVPPGRRRRVEGHHRSHRRLGGSLPRGVLGEPHGDLLGLVAADEHLRGDLVHGAAADGVVRRVLDQPPPGKVEQPFRPGGPVQRLERLAVSGQGALGARHRRLQVESGRQRPHEHVRPGARAQLPAPAPTVRASVHDREVVRERGDLRGRAALFQQVGQLRQRLHVVGAEHGEDRLVSEELAVGLAHGVEPATELTGDVEEIGAVAVAVREVLGADGGAVRGLPFERVRVDRRRHASPDDGGVDPRLPQDLRHLRDMAEHVRQVADRHRAAELGRTPLPVLEVARDRLARDEKLVHQHLPGPDREPSLLDQTPDAVRLPRAAPRDSRRALQAVRRA